MVLSAARSAVESGRVMIFPAGSGIRTASIVDSHKRAGDWTESRRCGFYAVFTGMSEDAILFRSIANDSGTCLCH